VHETEVFGFLARTFLLALRALASLLAALTFGRGVLAN
jgi:hypothetical protein